jgi:hypothetical protein
VSRLFGMIFERDRYGPSFILAAWVIATCVVLSMAGCKQLDWIEKKSPPEVPGEEKARLERIKKEAGPPGHASGRSLGPRQRRWTSVTFPSVRSGRRRSPS